MNSTLAGWLQFLLLFAALAACYIPLGNYIAHIFTDKKHWGVERGIYKLTGIDPDADMRWTVYVRSILAFSLVAVLFVYLIERTQHWLFWSVGMANVPTDTAWNTAVSFTTNTNWQNYAGEATMGYLTQQGALMVQQFFSAAVGLAAGAGLLLLAIAVVVLHFVSALAFSAVERQLAARLRGSTRLHIIYENGRGVLRAVLRICGQQNWQLTDADADAHDIDDGEVRVTMTLSGSQMQNSPEVFAAVDGVIAVLRAEDEVD